MLARTIRISGAGMLIALVALFSLRPASAATQTIDWGGYPNATPLASVSEPGVTFTIGSGDANTVGDYLTIYSLATPSSVTMLLAEPATGLAFQYDSFGNCGHALNSIQVLLGATVLDTVSFDSCDTGSISWPGEFDTVVFTAGHYTNAEGMVIGAVSFDRPGPEWTVAAKVGGGNVFNQFLPDYEPGTWSQKPVTVYLNCQSPAGPIDLLRRDVSTTFRDGEWSYSTKETDICRDANGNVAEAVEDWGPILVDTRAPVCKITPSTQYVARGASQQVTFGIELSDATSGIYNHAGGISLVAGGAIPTSWQWGPGDVPTSVTIDLTMGSSTAGRIEFTASVTDNAGHTSSCKAVVRAR
jgi:hypothetical protein